MYLDFEFLTTYLPNHYSCSFWICFSVLFSRYGCNNAPWKSIVPRSKINGPMRLIHLCRSEAHGNYECARTITNVADRHLARQSPRSTLFAPCGEN